jgi:hypothetical protein
VLSSALTPGTATAGKSPTKVHRANRSASILETNLILLITYLRNKYRMRDSLLFIISQLSVPLQAFPAFFPFFVFPLAAAVNQIPI